MVDTRPGDLIGADTEGRIRIDRVIPLPWLLGVVALMLLQAASVYRQALQLDAGQTQLRDLVIELKAEVRLLREASTAKDLKDTAHDVRLLEHERRITALEARK